MSGESSLDGSDAAESIVDYVNIDGLTLQGDDVAVEESAAVLLPGENENSNWLWFTHRRCFYDSSYQVTLVDKFINYAIGYSDDKPTLNGLQDWVNRLGADVVSENIQKYHLLHHYLAGNWAPCQPEGGYREEGYPPADIKLEVVDYILELAPDEVNTADNCTAERESTHTHFFAHQRGEGAYPLHIACFNSDCPESVIKLLLEKNPAIVKYSWENIRSPWIGLGGPEIVKYGLPLTCYLERNLDHPGHGHYNEDDEWEPLDHSPPQYPSGDVDSKTVQMLVDAYPEALIYVSTDQGTPLNSLCNGYDVSLDIAKLLIDKDRICLECDANQRSPIRTLLRNHLVNPFSIDVFGYLLVCKPNSLGVKTANDNLDKPGPDDYTLVCRSETALNMACDNPNITAEVVELIIKMHPEMLRMEYKINGYLPLHTLCGNQTLEEKSAIEILKLLVAAYPESLMRNTGDGIYGNIPDPAGGEKTQYPCHLAENMSFEFCKLLLAECAQFSSIPKATMLHIACAYDCTLGMVEAIVEHDPGSLLLEDGDGHIALHYAALCDSWRVIQYLVDVMAHRLSKGAQVQGFLGPNILHIVLQLCHKCEGLFWIVKGLVENNRELLLGVDGNGCTALHTCARYAPFALVKYLVEGAVDSGFTKPSISEDVANFIGQVSDITLSAPDNNGEVPLHKACYLGNMRVVNYLIEKNVSATTSCNSKGQLPMHILLCNTAGKDEIVSSVEYTEAVFKLLRAHPEQCDS